MNEEQLRKGPLYVVDFLPEQVPQDSRGQFSVIEEHYLDECENWAIYEGFLRIVLKLNCYYDFDVVGKKHLKHNPAPDKVEKWVIACSENRRERLTIFLNGGESLVEIQSGSLCMGVFCPDQTLCRRLERMATAEGLYFWRNESWKGQEG